MSQTTKWVVKPFSMRLLLGSSLNSNQDYNMRRNLIWAGVIAASFMISIPVQASIVQVDLTNDVANSTGNLLDNTLIPLTTLATTPLTAAVVETDSIGNATTNLGAVPGLIISVSGGSFDPANSVVNGSGSGFGINSPTPTGGSENASRFDVDAAEFAEFSFNQDVNLIDVHFTSFSGAEEFIVAGTTFTDGDVGTNNIAVTNLFVPAGTTIRLEAGGPAGSSVGIEGITIETLAIPEPTSIALLGLAGLGLVVRRRR